jgi:hypothetical protein
MYKTDTGRNTLQYLIVFMYRSGDNFRLVSITVSAWESVYATSSSCLQRETSKRHVGEADSVLTTAILLLQCLVLLLQCLELLLKQNSDTAHAHQSQAPLLASDHCATVIHRPKAAVRPICVCSVNACPVVTAYLHSEKIPECIPAWLLNHVFCGRAQSRRAIFPFFTILSSSDDRHSESVRPVPLLAVRYLLKERTQNA